MVLPRNFIYPIDSTSNKREGSPENESKTEFALMYRKKTAGIRWTRNTQRKNKEPCAKWKTSGKTYKGSQRHTFTKNFN